MKFGIVVFPGSNCDRDMYHVMKKVLRQETVLLWHKEAVPGSFTSEDCIILPGGFSYGDYLRPGAIARFSPVMESVIRFAQSGGYVLGICNGFQILCESGLLPGALLRNENQLFICKNAYIRTETANSRLTAGVTPGTPLKIPIAHADGRYYADAGTFEKLRSNDQILFRYCNPHGQVSSEHNPNGSQDNIAGICNSSRNVFGMMPHPERAAEEALFNTDGKRLLQSLAGMNIDVATTG